MYRPSLIQSLSILLLVLASESAHSFQTESNAEAIESNVSTDFSMPVTLDSKSQAIDGRAKTSIFTENVIIRQGSLELLADKVEVNAADGTGKEIIIATGSPASYKQRKEDGTWVEARATEIIYEVEPRTIALKGEALIMQNEMRVTGDMIVFDMTREQVLATSNDDSAESVRTVISPGAFSADDTQTKPENDEVQQ
ncbi:lipopolysaccharide transport periplasmic protein LptA [Glaciecola siphonariae]|uniref:Lipopolysaccharide export system protein LptA n=1 Tax=Glaciecola siphonariae TaxID=521012 RepID=A0ABV9M293_9ALTE